MTHSRRFYFDCPVCEEPEVVEVTVRATPGVGRTDFEEEVTEKHCPLTPEQESHLERRAYEEAISL